MERLLGQPDDSNQRYVRGYLGRKLKCAGWEGANLVWAENKGHIVSGSLHASFEAHMVVIFKLILSPSDDDWKLG